MCIPYRCSNHLAKAGVRVKSLPALILGFVILPVQADLFGFDESLGVSEDFSRASNAELIGSVSRLAISEGVFIRDTRQ